jgi:hypothetical protein
MNKRKLVTDRYAPSKLERIIYAQSYESYQTNGFNEKLIPSNPYDMAIEPLLWEAWEVGIIDAIEDRATFMATINQE